jgi:hypothetical protein
MFFLFEHGDTAFTIPCGMHAALRYRTQSKKALPEKESAFLLENIPDELTQD